MKHFLLLLTMMIVGCSTMGTAPQATPAAAAAALSAEDERQINAIFTGWEAAWNAHDMAAFGQLFHDDATFVIWTGRVLEGRKAIEDGHAQAHRTYFRDSTQLTAPQEVRAIGPGVAVARSLTTLTGDTRQPDITIRGHKLLVLTKRDATWKILFGQNTRLTPDAIAALPR